MLAEERYAEIVALVESSGSIKNKDLAQKLGVSIETIRRDLDVLAKANRIKKVHGGAVSKQLFGGKYEQLEYHERKLVELEEKTEIADCAMQLIRKGMHIALNAGTTNEALAQVLAKVDFKLTVVTNSINIVSILRENRNIRVIMVGGMYHREENAFFGPLCADFLKCFTVDAVFLAVSSVDLERGCMEFSEEEACVQREMMRIATEVYVLSSAQKINSTSLLQVCALDEVTAILTDTGVDPAVVQRYRDAGQSILTKDTTLL